MCAEILIGGGVEMGAEDDSLLIFIPFLPIGRNQFR
jgi:hypothetical protein